MSKRFVLKCVAVLVCVIFIGLAFILVSMVTHGGNEEDQRTVVATWYSHTPCENTLTLYDNGTYTSESYGDPDGSYLVEADNYEFKGSSGTIWEGLVQDGCLTIRINNVAHKYYPDKDLLPEKEPELKEVDYGVLGLRLTMAQKLLAQGEWVGDGHTLEGSMTELVLDGKKYNYLVDDVKISPENEYYYTLIMGDRSVTMTMDVDIYTNTYTIVLDGMTFSTNGDHLRLDS